MEEKEDIEGNKEEENQALKRKAAEELGEIP